MVASSKAAGKPPPPKPPPFHDAELRRGWRVLHQRLALTADPAAGALHGRATLTIAVLSTQCVSIDLHLRRVAVTAVTVAGAPAPYTLADPLPARRLTAVSSEALRPRVDGVREDQAALAPATAPAELSVSIPPAVTADVIDALGALRPADAAAAAAAAAAASADAPLPPAVTSVDQLPTVKVVVEWTVLDGVGAAVFEGDPAVMVVDGRAGRARSWMPCVDSLDWCDRCPWEILVSVPVDLIAVCSGDLVETRLVTEQDDLDDEEEPEAVAFADGGGAGQHRANTRGRGRQQRRMRSAGAAMDVAVGPPPLCPAKRFTYRLDAAAHAGDIALAVGPFLPLADPASPATVTHFCLPGKSRDLVHTMPQVFAQAHAFCCDYFNAAPPGASLMQVFVGEGGGGPHCAAGGLVIYPATLLHSARCIDEGFAARGAIATAVVSSYLGAMIRPRTPEDAWFVAGLASHVSALALTSILGKNWYKVRVNDIIREMADESGPDAPVLADVAKDPMFSIDKASPSVRRRAHLIAYIVERRIGGDVLRRALREVVAEMNRAYAAESAAHDEALLGLSVGPFLKRVRAICGTDVRNLVRSWAASRGTPRMRFGYRYNGRRHQTEFAIEQKATGHRETLSRGREGLLFQGPLCVRVMEPEGSFDHTVEVIDPVFVSELSCHCRRTKQKPATQAEKDAGEEPARIAPVSWVRVDPDMDWCIDVSFVQTEAAWIVMLHGERDAVAQMNACRGLVEYGTLTAAKALAECLSNSELYWRVRAEAARSLSSCVDGLRRLLEYFRETYCTGRGGGGGCEQDGGGKRWEADSAGDAERCSGAMHGLAANDFSDIGEYMVRRAVVKAIVATGTRKDGNVPRAVSEFVISLLADDDNSRNAYDEDHYIADLIRAAAQVAVLCINDGRRTTARIAELIKRHRLLDHLVPSRSGVVGAVVVVALADVEIAVMARESSGARESAIDRMLQCRLQPEPEMMRHILELLDPSAALVARSAALAALARLYGGDLETVQWILARADRARTGDDVIAMDAERRRATCRADVESSSVRLTALEALIGATKVTAWRGQVPMLTALRRHTKRAMLVCVRVLRLAVGDGDERVRRAAVDLAEAVWGHGVPVCLLEEHEYREETARVAREKLRQVQEKKEHARAETAAARGEMRKGGGTAGSSGGSSLLYKPPVTPGTQLGGTRKKVSPSGVGASKHKLGSNGSAWASGRESGGNRERTPAALQRPALGVPILKPLPAPVVRPLDVDLLVAEEDRRYLVHAWTEHTAQQPALFAAPALPQQLGVAAPAPDVSLPSTSVKGGDGGGDSVEEEERRRRRRRRKKKRKREDEDLHGGPGEHGDDSHRKKKKKKKRRLEGGPLEGTVAGGGGVPHPASFAGAGGVTSGGPVPSSEGSVRSDGRLSIKIKIGGTTAAHLSKD
jgi:hypothetical protein